MPCPNCLGSNMTLYDMETYECKDCGHLTHKSRYEHKSEYYETHKGFCKIVSIDFTKNRFGTNRDMVAQVSDTHVRNYETERLNDNSGKRGTAYRIGKWVWDKRDLIIVDEKGNEIVEFPNPEPVQFNANTLFI